MRLDGTWVWRKTGNVFLARFSGTKLNLETITRRQERLIPLLLTMPVETACAAAKPTVYKWLKSKKGVKSAFSFQGELPGLDFYFMTLWTHRAAASFSLHSACLCTVVLISNLLSK
jgi:hypothetical protein